MSKYKPNLEPTEDRKQTAFVIERTNEIEYKLKQILVYYFSFKDKSKERFMDEIMMNNALFPLSSKVKAYMHLNKKESWPEISGQLFQDIMKLRNAFAHDNGNEVINVVLGDKGSAERVVYLESVSAGGTLTEVSRDEALDDFTQNYAVANEHLLGVINLLRVV